MSPRVVHKRRATEPLRSLPWEGPKERSARGALEQAQRLADAGDHDGLRRLLRYQLADGTSVRFAVIRAWVEWTGGILDERTPDGLLLEEAVEAQVEDHAAAVGGDAEQHDDGVWRWYEFENGDVLAYRSHATGLWLEDTPGFVTMEQAARAKAEAAVDARHAQEKRGELLAVDFTGARDQRQDAEAGASEPDRSAGGGAVPSSVPHNADAGPDQPAPAAPSSLPGAPLPKAPADSPPPSPTEPPAQELKPAPAGSVLELMRREQRARQGREAERILREAAASQQRALTLAERLSVGGLRQGTPGLACFHCGRPLGGDGRGHSTQLEHGEWLWAHPGCVERLLAEERCPFGTRSDMRAELGATGVQLTGGESFDELKSAVFAARRKNALDVDWSGIEPKAARTEKACALVSGCRIAPKTLYRDGGADRAACEGHVAELLKARGT